MELKLFKNTFFANYLVYLTFSRRPKRADRTSSNRKTGQRRLHDAINVDI